MFFWRRVAPQIPEEGLKPTATPSYTRNFRELNQKVAQGKSFSGYERNALFLNRKGEGFTDVGGLLRVDFFDDARAVGMVDWDRDGDLDMWVANRTAPQVRLLENRLAQGRPSIAVRLEGNGKTTNRDAIGARLTLSTASKPDDRQIRTVHAGDGFLAQSSAWQHFGLGEEAGVFKLVVNWPGGSAETFSGLQPGGRYVIRQGQKAEADSVGNVVLASVETQAERAARPSKKGFWVANRVPFPELKYTNEAGLEASTTAFQGRPVLVNLWATWCLPCLAELREFGKQADALEAMGATVLALNVDGLSVEGGGASGGNREGALAKAGYGMPHGVARQENLALIEILIEFLSARRMPLSIPSSFLVDRKGEVAAVYLEPVSGEQLVSDLALLEAPLVEQVRRFSPRPGRWVIDPQQVERTAYHGDYATTFVKNGFPEESERLYQMIQSGERTAQEYYNQAKTAAQQGAMKKAEELYREAIRRDPEYGPALTGLGALFLMQKKPGEAEIWFKRALALDPNHATALVNLAMIDQAKGDKASALKRLNQVLARNPGYSEAHLNVGTLHASMKDYEKAIHHLTRAIQLNPGREVAYLNLASAYRDTNRLAEAEQQYRKVLQLKPRVPYAHYGLGTLQARNGQHEQAVASLKKRSRWEWSTPMPTPGWVFPFSRSIGVQRPKRSFARR
ncbi:MAG: tetratricopeptide repeat protein [Verrucomicrobiota bacterium]